MKKYSLLALVLVSYTGSVLARESSQQTVIPNNSDVRYVTSVKNKSFNPLDFLFRMLAMTAGAGALYQGKDITEKCLGAGLLTLGGLSTLSMAEQQCDTPRSCQFKKIRSCMCKGMNTIGLAAWLAGFCAWMHNIWSEKGPEVYRNMKENNFVPAAYSLALIYCLGKVLSKGFPAMWHSMMQDMQNQTEEAHTISSFVINKNPNNELTSIEIRSPQSSMPMESKAECSDECIACINCSC